MGPGRRAEGKANLLSIVGRRKRRGERGIEGQGPRTSLILYQANGNISLTWRLTRDEREFDLLPACGLF